ncbi:hypothetical protein M3Y94_00428700 [Aphelenchoides besseyi]|nr:hypothetical protein M3Y94_00428700 [Aphelenchoides besseyi]
MSNLKSMVSLQKSKNSISSAYFRHCSHGTFIFFMTHINKESSFGRIDLVYHISIDETQKTVQLTPIDLPILATGDSIEYDYGDGPRFHKNWHIGLVEVQNELYFYRLDFDGEIFFINWNSSKSSGNWEKFSIDGDYEPKAWNKDLNTSFNSVRFYLPDGIFYQRNWKEEDTIFYQLDIQPDIRHCK